MEEAFNSLDIDDYEVNDDIDGSMEALISLFLIIIYNLNI